MVPNFSYSSPFAGLAIALYMFCGSASAEGAWENLAKVSSPVSVTLGAAYSATTPNGKQAFGAKPGVYTSDQENTVGTYFRGVGAPVVFQFGDKFRAYPGGIWVPKAPGTKPQLYIYGKSAPIEYSTFASALEDLQNKPPASGSSGTGTAESGLLAQTIVSQPVRISPGAAGVAGGIVGGLMAYADSKETSSTPALMPRTEISDEAVLRALAEQKQSVGQ